jgi:hypothetical protein
LDHSTTHRKIAGGVSYHSLGQISGAATPFSFLRLDSRHEQGTKKTPDEELAEKVHLRTSSFEDLDIYSLRERLRVNDLV